jgi:hypothetical protein
MSSFIVWDETSNSKIELKTKLYTQSYELIENECVPPLREAPQAVWQQ